MAACFRYGDAFSQIKARCQWLETGCGPPPDCEFFLLMGGTLPVSKNCRSEMAAGHLEEDNMHGLIYLVGLIVVILAVLSFFGLR